MSFTSFFAAAINKGAKLAKGPAEVAAHFDGLVAAAKVGHALDPAALDVARTAYKNLLESLPKGSARSEAERDFATEVVQAVGKDLDKKDAFMKALGADGIADNVLNAEAKAAKKGAQAADKVSQTLSGLTPKTTKVEDLDTSLGTLRTNLGKAGLIDANAATKTRAVKDIRGALEGGQAITQAEFTKFASGLRQESLVAERGRLVTQIERAASASDGRADAGLFDRLETLRTDKDYPKGKGASTNDALADLKAGRPVSDDSLTALRNHHTRPVDPPAPPPAQVAAQTEAAIAAARGHQKTLALEVEGFLSAPKPPGAFSRVLNSFASRGANRGGADFSQATQQHGGRTLQDAMSDLRTHVASEAYQQLPVKEARFGRLSPSDTLSALHDGYRVPEADFRRLNERISHGSLGTGDFFSRHPKMATLSALGVAYTGASMFALTFPSLGSFPIISIAPYTLATDLVDKPTMGGDGKIKPGHEDYSAQVDWELKKAEYDDTGKYRRDILLTAYSKLPDETTRSRVLPFIKAEIGEFLNEHGGLTEDSKSRIANANEWQRVAGTAFIARYTGAATDIVTQQSEAQTQAAEAERARIEASAPLAGAPSAEVLNAALSGRVPAGDSDTTKGATSSEFNSMNGAEVFKKLQAARDGKLIKEDEFQNLCVAWAQSTKAPVDQDKELTAANVGTPQEVGDFKTAMEEILGRNPDRRAQIVKYVTGEILGSGPR